jgi:hypothetical protein
MSLHGFTILDCDHIEIEQAFAAATDGRYPDLWS